MTNQRFSISADLFLAPVTESGFQSAPMTLTDPDKRAVITLSPHIPLLSVEMNRPNVSSRYGDASHHTGSVTLVINKHHKTQLFLTSQSQNDHKCSGWGKAGALTAVALKRGPASSLV